MQLAQEIVEKNSSLTLAYSHRLSYKCSILKMIHVARIVTGATNKAASRYLESMAEKCISNRIYNARNADTSTASASYNPRRNTLIAFCVSILLFIFSFDIVVFSLLFPVMYTRFYPHYPICAFALPGFWAHKFIFTFYIKSSLRRRKLYSSIPQIIWQGRSLARTLQMHQKSVHSYYATTTLPLKPAFFNAFL